MGYRIDSYKRDELRKIALPGQAVSTLFWVLPMGRWNTGELDRWWEHFTRHPGTCQALGLLLVRDHSARADRKSEQSADLQKGLAAIDGGSLADLIPEAERHTQYDKYRSHRGKSLLIFSGAYPQPGWGVMLDLKQGNDDPDSVEQLLKNAVLASCGAAGLASIQGASQAYHSREKVRSHQPSEPEKPAELEGLSLGLADFDSLLAMLATGSVPELESAVARVRNVFKCDTAIDPSPDGSLWNDLNGRLRILRDLSGPASHDPSALVSLWEAFHGRPPEERDAHLQGLAPREIALLKKIRHLSETWPDFNVGNLDRFLANDFRADLKKRIEEAIRAPIETLEFRLAEVSGTYEMARQRHESQLTDWKEKRRESEASYRAALGPATTAQWELGPKFLMEVESACRESGTPVRSITWDPARMIGWKLHVSKPGLQPRHLVMAANSVLGTSISESGIAAPGNEFSGSLFADYAYFVSISAKRLSPWLATRNLMIKLLSLAELDELAGTPAGPELLPQVNEQDLAERLLQKWGWEQPPEDATRSLAACIATSANGKATLATTLNETRVSFEGFVKDLCRVTVSNLGWPASDMKQQLSIHCPAYRWTTRDGWSEESSMLSAGAALVLLTDLVPLAFPNQLDLSDADQFWRLCKTLLSDLNRGSHHPPPPSPTPEELCNCADLIASICAAVGRIIGEMPWHLSPTQTFGTEPTIVTGYAWSHSHPEERLIRVILSEARQPSKRLLVWNKTLTNPVMTDAVIV